MEALSRSRNYLKLFFFILSFLGLSVLLYFFVQTMSPTENAIQNRPFFEVALNEINEGEAKMFEWKGKPFYIFHRNQEQIESINLVRQYLRDPDFKINGIKNKNFNHVSLFNSSNIIVVSLLTNHSSCGVKFIPKSSPLAPSSTWVGGFVETCKGAIYDVAGRVYSVSKLEALNLEILMSVTIGSNVQVYFDDSK
jgi:ubiquinol-cytochrome c reductase iron-sulfur subunit